MSVSIKMGSMGPLFNGGESLNITLCVTEECNLRCKYCYMEHKNSRRRMSLETAKRIVDYCLALNTDKPSVIWDFIGGEPTLEMELIDKISDYIKERLYTLKHPWFNGYIFNIGTNGILYGSPSVQKYIQKNRNHISINITIDGTKEKHDMQRVYADGTGSYDDVINNVKLWHEQFPNAYTKVTFSSDDLPLLKESIIHLWNLGLKTIPANVVFEDVWKDGDDEIYEEQLRELADYAIETEAWKTCSVRFFDPEVGLPLGKGAKQMPYCGVGKMLAFDSDGTIFPCIRFLDFCTTGKPSLSIGTIDRGINTQIRSLFKRVNMDVLNDGECATCPVASGCFSCTACNYEYSPNDSIYMRTRFHCKMQKAQARANEYFWDRLSEKLGEPTPYELTRMRNYQNANWMPDGAKYLYFILEDGITPHCMYESAEHSLKMPESVFKSGIEYAYSNHMIPVYLGNADGYLFGKYRYKLHVEISRFDSEHMPNRSVCKYIPIYSADNYSDSFITDVCIYSLTKNDIGLLCDRIEKLSKVCHRINVVKKDLYHWTEKDVQLYTQELITIKGKKLPISLNLFDKGQSKDECLFGKSEYSLAPDGKFYTCPGFYFKSGGHDVGDIQTGIYHQEAELYTLRKSPECMTCSQRKCKRCFLINQRINTELSVPADIICTLTQEENNIAGI